MPSKNWLERKPQIDVETTPQSVTEPNSGFRTALSNIYQHVLDTYISVLSSISSHILHSIFYEVIETAFVDKDRLTSPDVVIFVCKVAEKIITIC